MKKTLKASKPARQTATNKDAKAKECKEKCKKACAKINDTVSKAKPSAPRKTRADARQLAKVKRLESEQKALSKTLGAMFDEIRSAKFKTLPLIDQHLTLAMFNALETYITALNMKKSWERVRLRNSAGEKLNKCVVGFWDFAFGRGMFRTHDKKSAK